MKKKDFKEAMDLRGPEFMELLHGFRSIASLAQLTEKLPPKSVRSGVVAIYD
jgi:6-phosphofructokinase 1